MKIPSYTKKAVIKLVGEDYWSSALTPKQQRGLLEFATHIGMVEFRKSDVVELVQSGEFKEAANEMMRYALDGTEPNVEWLLQRQHEAELLMDGQDDKEVFLATGVSLTGAAITLIAAVGFIAWFLYAG